MPFKIFRATLFLFFLSLRALAVMDAEHQGGGGFLLPVSASDLQPINIDIHLTALPRPRCVHLLFEQKQISARMHFTQFSEGAIAAVGTTTSCTANSNDRLLRIVWHAQIKMKYRASLTKTTTFAFKSPLWLIETQGNEGTIHIPAPSTVGLTVTSGHTIYKAQSENSANLEKEVKFTIPLKKGQIIELVTDYDMGADYLSDLAKLSRTPWFVRQEAGGSTEGGAAATLKLNWLDLTKLAPQAIHAEVTLPLSDFHIAEIKPKPSCLDGQQVVFHWKNEVPQGNLEITYPHLLHFDHPDDINSYKAIESRVIENAPELKSWQTTVMSETTQVTCRTLAELRRGQSPELLSTLEQIKCVDSCRF